MEKLFRYARTNTTADNFVEKILTAFKITHENASLSEPTKLASANRYFESLSSRELDVLRLFNTELSGPEIANELTVALSTIRSHTKNIYGKLAVNSRRAAVKRALELDLI